MSKIEWLQRPGTIASVIIIMVLLLGSDGRLSSADDVLDHWVYLPLIAKEFEPVVVAPTPTRPPWATATPIPTMCELIFYNDTADELYYLVVGTSIGWRLGAESWGHLYGSFPAGRYTWYAESRKCGQASGNELFPAPEVRPGSLSACHTFTCVEGVLVGILSPYPQAFSD